MPSYELTLISKVCPRSEAMNIVKRVVNGIWERKGLVRDIEYQGTLKLPMKMSAHDRNHWKGIYWLVKMDMPIPIIDDFKDELKRDVDVIKIFAARLANEETIVHKVECMLEEESLPPAYRTDVHDLMTKGKWPVKSRKL